MTIAKVVLSIFVFYFIDMQGCGSGSRKPVEAVKFLWKWKYFEERSWKRKQTRKRL